MTEFAMTLSMAEEASAFSAGSVVACSDGRGGENKCSGSKRIEIRNGGSSKKGSLCYGSGSWKELLCLQGFWAYGLSL